MFPILVPVKYKGKWHEVEVMCLQTTPLKELEQQAIMMLQERENV